MAIDQRVSGGCLLHVSHGSEEAGLEINLSLPQFLAQQAALRPVWPDFSERFSFPDVITEVIPGDYRVREARFSLQSPLGIAWRDGFRGGGALMPANALLERCTALSIGGAPARIETIRFHMLRRTAKPGRWPLRQRPAPPTGPE